ncbi:hypothetical protein L195_g059646, partial [Trifolium pratense]
HEKAWKIKWDSLPQHFVNHAPQNKETCKAISLSGKEYERSSMRNIVTSSETLKRTSPRA